MDDFITNFHFIRPAWLLLMLPVPLLWTRLSQGRSGVSQWARTISPDLIEALLDQTPSRGSRSLAAITALGLVLSSLALSGPSWSRIEQPVQQRNDPLVIILDLSLSMLTEDVKPSRLVRARQKIADILRQRQEGLTGLVVYAGDAHTVAPLTDDTKTIENLLGSLSPGMMPVLGSHPEMALQLALKLMHNSAMNEGRILLITDGIDDISDFTQSVSPSFPVYVLGIGTAEGGPIPLDFLDRPGQFLEDRQGTRIVTRLDVERLSKVAQLSYGEYHSLTLSDEDINTLLQPKHATDDLSEASTRTFDVWQDRGYLLIFLLLPLVLLAFRKGAVVVLLLCILPAPAQGSTLDDLWSGLWSRSDQQAYRALNNGDPEKAERLFRDDYRKGLAEYRSGDYELSAQRLARFFQSHQNDNTTGQGERDIPPQEQTYNLGNALAKAGKYTEAIAAYEQTLATDPEHEDAAFNKALVEDLLKEQQSSSGNENQQQQDSGNKQDSEQNQQQNQQQNQSSQDQNTEDSQQSDQQEKESKEQEQQAKQQTGDGKDKAQQSQSDETEEEKQQALEQWLRRVPDDPGGLLRRKFRHETNQKLRSGEFRRPSEERIW